MKKPFTKIREAATKATRRLGGARLTLTQALAGAVIVLVVGVGIGASTNIWNRSLQIIGFKPNVPAIDLSSLQDTYAALAANYDGKLDTAKLVDGANHGLVAAAGNPYTVYFNSSEVTSFNDSLNGNFSGIGAELAIRNSTVTIQSVLDNSPAKKAGLQTGDVVSRVNGTDTAGWSVDKAATTIRGDAGTSVTLTINRDGDTRDYAITRAALTDPSVKSDVIGQSNGDIGLITISRFSDDTGELARTAATTLKQKGVKGIVLDMRGNGGGRVDAAQDVASLWLDNKTIVSERKGSVTVQTLTSQGDPVLNGIPTVVLIDGGTASASEIVAGALRDNGAATLIGEKSFGKGSFQDLLNLPGGNELKVTVGRWYTPKGVNIDKAGLTPDTVITPTDDQLSTGADPVKDAALERLNG